MKISFTDTSSHSGHLILLFAGWGMSDRPLRHIAMPGYDMAVVWDYRDMSAPWLCDVENYSEIVVVAWSYGVHAASRFMATHPQLPVTARIAVNGTRFTADDTRGIPRAIFDATLAGLNERNMTKFNMRMCGGAAAYKTFAANAPVRDVADLHEELQAFDTEPAPALMWDKAFVSDADMIIPPANQLTAWTDEAVEIITVNGPHLPDFTTILHRSLTDKQHVERRFRKAEATYNDNADVQATTTSRLLDILSETSTPHDNARMLEIGCGTGQSTKLAFDRIRPSKAMLWDLHIAPQIRQLGSLYPAIDITTADCDAEVAIHTVPDGSVDILLSASTVQWFNSLRTFLTQVERVLSPGGVAAISTYGPDTMREIHQSAGTQCRFPSVESIRRMIPEGLILTSMSEEHTTVSFNSAIDVLRHMSRTGVNALTTSDGNTAAATRMLRSYPLAADGSAPLTYHPIYLILKKL